MSRNSVSKIICNSGGDGIASTRNGLRPLEPEGVVTPNEKRLNVADERDVVRGKTEGERGTTMTITEAEGVENKKKNSQIGQTSFFFISRND